MYKKGDGVGLQMAVYTSYSTGDIWCKESLEVKWWLGKEVSEALGFLMYFCVIF